MLRSVHQRLPGLLLLVLLTGACHPGPSFVRKRPLTNPTADQALLHGFYRNEDPWKFMPSWGPCWVEQVDEATLTREALTKNANTVVLSPGLHWFVVRVTSPMSPDYSAAFELNFEPGREYALSFEPTCSAFGKKSVKRSTVDVKTVSESEPMPVMRLVGICSRRGHTCRFDHECDDGLVCVVRGETGFGLCGRR